jgi:hypothetical protein
MKTETQKPGKTEENKKNHIETRKNHPATPDVHVNFTATERTFGSSDSEKLHKTKPKSVVTGTWSDRLPKDDAGTETACTQSIQC